MGKKYSLVILFCITVTMLSFCLGAARLRFSSLWSALLAGPADTAGFIFWYVRLPRTAACLLSGAALSVSGAVIQNVLNNKLASPSIIGVNAGAGLAVTLCCAAGALSGWAVACSAFLGATVTVLLIVFVSRKAGASRTTVILGGVAVNATLNAMSEAVTTLLPEVGMLTADFRVGGFASVSHVRLLPAAVGILTGLVILFLLHNELDVLSLGAEVAHSLGLSVNAFRTLFLILAAMLSGCSVSFSGLLGFVGLIVPHSVRKLSGGSGQHFLPLCALLGAGFVTFCDLVGRLLFAPYELPVGILLSALGGPFFLFLLINQRGGIRHA